MVTFTDDLDLPGPLRLIVTYFRDYCEEVQRRDDLDREMKAFQIIGAANMTQRWACIYSGFVFTNGECQAAVDLVNAECRLLIGELTKSGCTRQACQRN